MRKQHLSINLDDVTMAHLRSACAVQGCTQTDFVTSLIMSADARERAFAGIDKARDHMSQLQTINQFVAFCNANLNRISAHIVEHGCVGDDALYTMDQVARTLGEVRDAVQRIYGPLSEFADSGVWTGESGYEGKRPGELPVCEVCPRALDDAQREGFLAAIEAAEASNRELGKALRRARKGLRVQTDAPKKDIEEM